MLRVMRRDKHTKNEPDFVDYSNNLYKLKITKIFLYKCLSKSMTIFFLNSRQAIFHIL